MTQVNVKNKSYDVCVTSWRMRLLHVSYVCGGDGGAVLMTEEVKYYRSVNRSSVDKIAIFWQFSRIPTESLFHYRLRIIFFSSTTKTISRE